MANAHSPLLRPFATISRSQQRKRLHASAQEALARFCIDDATIRLINYDFNATYRVERPSGSKFALRLNVNSARDRAAVAAEAAWVSALSEVDNIIVPTPQTTPDGEIAIDVSCAGVDKPVPAVLYSWLDGPDVGERASLRTIGELGRIAARLHDHATSWKPPAGVSFASMDYLMLDEPDNLSNLEAPWFDAVKATVLETLTVAEEATAPLFVGAGAMPIHADLHTWNVKIVDGGMAVFDFDDAGLGREIQDLSTSAYYLLDRRGGVEALLDGYASERAMPDHTSEQWQALLAGRNLVLLNSVVPMVTAGYDDFLPKYAERSAARMRHYLDTGQFKLDLEESSK